MIEFTDEEEAMFDLADAQSYGTPELIAARQRALDALQAGDRTAYLTAKAEADALDGGGDHE